MRSLIPRGQNFVWRAKGKGGQNFVHIAEGGCNFFTCSKGGPEKIDGCRSRIDDISLTVKYDRDNYSKALGDYDQVQIDN